MRRLRGAALAVAATLAAVLGASTILAACDAGPRPDPYAVLDQARITGWDRVEARLGFGVETQPSEGDGFPIPPTKINVDPSSIRLTLDNPTGRWRFALSLTPEDLGVDSGMIGMLGPRGESIELEALYDGADLYARGTTLESYLTGLLQFSDTTVEGDLTGWVRFGPVDALAPLPGGILGIPTLPDIEGALPLPSAGDAGSLQTFLEGLGVLVTHAGFESDLGLETHHLSAALNLAALAQSPTFSALTGMGREELLSLFRLSSDVMVTADAWVDRNTGRLVTLRVDARVAGESPITAFLVLQLREPPAETTFDAPGEFTDVPLAELLEPPFLDLDG